MTGNRPLTVALKVCSAIAIGFGALTIAAGGRALFGDAAARAAVGDAVPFVLWFNFAAGFAYVAAGAGLWSLRRWASWLSVLIAGGTALVLVAFALHVFLGGAFEMRTAGAMFLRTFVWAAIAVVAMRQPTR